MKKRIRRFVDGAPYHICSKGVNGFCIFYSFKDILVYITMYYVFAKVGGIVTEAACIMVNHTHSLVRSRDCGTLSSFVRNLESAFAAEYNQFHNRIGQLFKHRFGGAPKPVKKLITSCIIYIINNPVAGRICQAALNYRWNLLAYRNCQNPYSKPLHKRHCSNRLLIALKTVDIAWENHRYLGYNLIENIFAGLAQDETRQLIDYIVTKYMIIDFSVFDKEFNGMENALTAIEATYGSEYDIKEDWDDYGIYERMKSIIRSMGYPQNVNFETTPSSEIEKLSKVFRREAAANDKQIKKFLHIK